ncbi:MAG: phosphoribosylglycinamide formyltransferase [Amnibacterium sp.]
MLSVVVLISGSGTNLRALLERCADPRFPVHVVAVGADRDAPGLVHADEFGVPSFLVPYPAYPSRDAWGQALLAEIAKWRPDVVVLSGLMRLLPRNVVDALAPRLINTHPAFLPEFPGAHAVRDALAAGAAETGASVIVVDHGVDSGPVLARERVPVRPGDTEGVLHDRIKPVERRLLADVLEGVATGRIDLTETTEAVG